MQSISKSEIYLRVIAWTVLILGVAMVVYWIMFLVKRMPIGDIPVLSESITACLALITGYGLLYRKHWSVPCCLVLAGMLAYSVIGGITIVFKHGLNFDSPFGAITDALLFPLILLFSIFMIVTIWRQKEYFNVS